MTVVPLTRSNEFWSLTPGREYAVIGVDHESYRVVDDKGEPILFPREGFRVVDDTIPQDWIWDRQSGDEYYGGPEGVSNTWLLRRLFRWQTGSDRAVYAAFATQRDPPAKNSQKPA